MIDWPIGTPEERRVAIDKLPGKWFNANPYMNKYRYGYHTGLDLNLNDPYWNADKDAPVYAIADGVVTFSGIGRGYTWGYIIVTRCGGFWVRYAHLRHDPFMVNGTLIAVPNVGDTVLCGQQIARVGDAEDFYEPGGHHLHFDIARNDILEHDASDWPGLDYRLVQRNYVDPFWFISTRKAIQGIPPVEESPVTFTDAYVNTPNSRLLLRSQPRRPLLNDNIEVRIPHGTKVEASDLVVGAYRFVRWNDWYGFGATEYLSLTPI